MSSGVSVRWKRTAERSREPDRGVVKARLKVLDCWWLYWGVLKFTFTELPAVGPGGNVSVSA